MNFIHRVREFYKRRGIKAILIFIIKKYFINPMLFYYWIIFKSSKSFTFRGESYPYFYHQYNTTWNNERAIEIPIIWRIVNNHEGKNILEVGNVLSNYYNIAHDVLDKYEKAPGVINEDVATFLPPCKYDLIVSISTMEHVGKDECLQEPGKVLSGFENLTKCLAPEGVFICTLPLNYNNALDDHITNNRIYFEEQYFLKRITKDNNWIEVNYDNVSNSNYNSPFPKANAIRIGLIREKSHAIEEFINFDKDTTERS